MQTQIKFGTSGWRGLIARDFTFENVRLAAQGVAEYLKQSLADKTSPIYQSKPVVILGYDTRFLGREFALAVAEVFEANGLEPLLCERDTPTPVIAYTIRRLKAIGGVNMTASHNPAAYQGLKFSTSNGAPANTDVTSQIENFIVQLQAQQWQFNPKPVGLYQCKTINPQPAYFKRIKQLVQMDVIKKAKLKVAIEVMYGAGRGYLETLLGEADAKITVFS